MEIKDIIETPVVNDSENIEETEWQKPREFEAYALWLNIPALMKSPPPQKNGVSPDPKSFAIGIGIEDETVLELVQLRTGQDFAKKYGVHINTLTRWKKDLKARGIIGLNKVREWAEDMTGNIVMSMYNHVMKKGNPHLFKLWFQTINGWNEKTKVEHQFVPIVSIEHKDYVDTKPIETEKNRLDKDGETKGGVEMP